MKTKDVALLQQENIPQTAAVSPGGRRPEGKTPAEASQNTPDPQVKTTQRAPRRTFSTAYKLKILEAYDACDNALARGALLRKEGLYSSRISTWKKQLQNGKFGSRKTPKSILLNQQQAREIASLKKKLAQAHTF